MKAIKLFLCLVLPGLVFSQTNVYNEVNSLRNQGVTFEVLNLFTQSSATLQNFDVGESKLDKANILTLDITEVRKLKANDYQHIFLSLPGPDGKIFNALLTQHEVLAPGFKLYAASNPNEEVTYEAGIHFKGFLINDPKSLVSISVFNEQVMALIANEEGNYVIGKIGIDGFDHIIYNDQDLDGPPPGECATVDDGISYTPEQLQQNNNRDAGDCIQIYIEIDNDIVNQKGGVTPATNYIEGLFAQTYILYDNDGLVLQTSQILAWDVVSPYSGTSSSAMLNSFQANTGSFPGDLAHLVSYQASGGIAAGFNGICNSNVDNSKCFSSINSTYADVPTYSWSVMVVAHEMGHLIGSRHTHACVWNGNGTAIDGCYPTEGSCPQPGNPSNGGTIMSYCHLVGGVGINLNNGFGPQPTAVLQNTVNNASCLDNCDGASCYNGIQDGDETGVDCGGSICDPCPTCSDGIQNGDETGVDCGGSVCPECPPAYCDSRGLNSSYEYISNVQLADLNHSSGNNGGYADFSAQTASLDADASYTITLTPEFPGTVYAENWQVWIDYNGDYDFNDVGELVASGTTTTASPISLNFTVPSLSGNITTGMRVSMAWSTIPGPCENFSYGEVEDYSVAISAGSEPTCNDGIQNGDETGVDCGGSVCPACPTCSDGIQNGDETGIDCGGPDCPACPTCSDGIQNGGETGVDCGGPDCPDCPTCSDGIQNGDETGIDCGGNDCPACPTCFDGVQNGDETGIDCGGSCPSACPTCSDGIQNGDETGVDCGGSCPQACPTCSDGIQNGDETGIDCGGSCPTACPTCSDGIQNGDETGIDCGGTICGPCPTCSDGIQNGDETGIDCGGSCPEDCPTCEDNIQNGDEEGVDCGGTSCDPCPTCSDGIQNGDETGIDCGGSCPEACPTCEDNIQNGDEEGVDCGGAFCNPCPTCSDGIQNGDETGIDCGGSCPEACPTCEDNIQNGDEEGVDCGGAFCNPCPTCSDGIQNGDETGVDCGGSCPQACPTCSDGIQNGDEEGIDCGGSNCVPCATGCTYQLINFNDFDNGWGIWNDGGSDCRRSANDAAYAYSGNRPVRLRDNTSSSTTTTDILDLSAYDEITIDFTYIARSMDNSNEDFWLQISTNGGSSYTTVEEWNRGDEFENLVREFDQVVIPGPFTSNTRLRFRCDASGNQDWVYIDDVEITGCYNTASLPEPGEETPEVLTMEDFTESPLKGVEVFPNPAMHYTNLQFIASTDGEVHMRILQLETGRTVNEQEFYRNKGEHTVFVDLANYPGGVYLIQLMKDGQSVVKKVVVSR